MTDINHAVSQICATLLALEEVIQEHRATINAATRMDDVLRTVDRIRITTLMDTVQGLATVLDFELSDAFLGDEIASRAIRARARGDHYMGLREVRHDPPGRESDGP